VGSTQTFIVDGAVPNLGEIFSQARLLVAVQLSVPPPLFLMDRDPSSG
jgi:hypothetical protein